MAIAGIWADPLDTEDYPKVLEICREMRSAVFEARLRDANFEDLPLDKLGLQDPPFPRTDGRRSFVSFLPHPLLRHVRESMHAIRVCHAVSVCSFASSKTGHALPLPKTISHA